MAESSHFLHLGRTTDMGPEAVRPVSKPNRPKWTSNVAIRIQDVVLLREDRVHLATLALL